MQIRLLFPFQYYKANQIVSLAIDWERYLIVTGQATYDLTGGVPYVAPAAARRLVPASLVLDGTGAVLGIEGPGGSLIPVSGSATAPGAPTGLTLTAGLGAVNAAFLPPANNGGSPVTSYTVTLSNGATGSGIASPITVATPGGVAVTATVKAHTAFAPNGGASSVASNSVTPTIVVAPVAPTVLTQTKINGTPTVNVPLAITAATFSGSPAPTGTRTIKMGAAVVATGNLTTTYTPLQADVGKVPTVEDVGTNTVGSATSTATGAAVAAAAVVDDPVQISAVGISGNYTKVGLLEPNRKELVVKNTLPWTIEVVQNNALNYQQNLPTSGHIQVLPGKEWDTDETATVWARLYGATATAASFDGTKITATVASHKFVAGMKVAASQAVPAGFNTLAWPNAVDITIVDGNTISYVPQVAPAVGAATTMPVLNAIGSIIVEKKVNK